jgi:hypothetical protein
MTMKKLITALLLTVLIPATSFARTASYENGNSLLAKCENKKIGKQTMQKISDGTMNKGICFGYLTGISDAHGAEVSWGLTEPRFCSPKGVIRGQLVKVVIKYLNERPETVHLSASSLVNNALYLAFPPSFKDDGTRYCPEGTT